MILRRNILIFPSSILMILMLVWLTISAPFVGVSMQQKAKTEKKGNPTSPLAGSEEEKVPSSPSPTANEYLHENEELQHASITIITSYRTHHITAYIAFHGDLVSPPPKALISS